MYCRFPLGWHVFWHPYKTTHTRFFILFIFLMFFYFFIIHYIVNCVVCLHAAEIQNATSTRIQLSRSNEHYPGTNERVMIIYGTTGSIIQAVKHTFDKVSGIDID